MAIILRYLALVLGFVFIYFAVVQYNDPDNFIWILIYISAAIVSFAAFMNKFNRALLALIMVASLVGAIYLWPDHYEGVALKDGMKTIEIETARESFGLGIYFLAAAIYMVASFLKKPSA